MDVSQYLEIFLDEAKEHFENLNTQILKLEQEPEDTDTINEIFRAVKYVQVCRQHTVQNKTQRCEIEVHSPGRWTTTVGRDTWRHMWSPHWRKSTCRQSIPTRLLLADSPPGCNCTSNQV